MSREIFTINADTGCIDGFDSCADELDSLYEHTIRQESLIDLLSSAVDDLILN